jgi:cytochrome b561
MIRISARQIALRSMLSKRAVYQPAAGHAVKRSNLTRLLHLLLLVCVIHQMIGSEFLSRPLPGEAPSLLFRLHEYIGMGSLGVVFAFWLWAVARHGETSLAELFPWASPRRTRAIFSDIICRSRELTGPELLDRVSQILASTIHGLGLLVVTAMAATGTVYFLASGTLAHAALALHRLISNLMWAYLIGHAAIALLHHPLGSDILRRMFWIKRGRTERVDRFR